jgi:CBS domain-containing protein
MQLREIMTTGFKMIGRNAAVQQAAEIMRDQDVGILPVLEENQIVGTVTDRDITVRATAAGMAPDTPVSSVMSTGLVFGHEKDDAETAVNAMEDMQVRRLLVMDESEKCVGIVSLGDIAVRTGDRQLGAEVLQEVSEPAKA